MAVQQRLQRVPRDRPLAKRSLARAADYINENFARSLTLDEISVAAGGKHIIYNAMMASLDPGETLRTRMFRGASSCASERMKRLTPPLDAA